MNGESELTGAQIAALTSNSEPWLSCESCFEQTDSAVEALVAAGTDLHEPFRVHLRNCPACLGEAESLAELIAVEFGRTPEDARAALARQLATER